MSAFSQLEHKKITHKKIQKNTPKNKANTSSLQVLHKTLLCQAPRLKHVPIFTPATGTEETLYFENAEKVKEYPSSHFPFLFFPRFFFLNKSLYQTYYADAFCHCCAFIVGCLVTVRLVPISLAEAE